MPERYQFIPQDLLDADEQITKSSGWATQKRSEMATLWGQSRRQAMVSTIEDQFGPQDGVVRETLGVEQPNWAELGGAPPALSLSDFTGGPAPETSIGLPEFLGGPEVQERPATVQELEAAEPYRPKGEPAAPARPGLLEAAQRAVARTGTLPPLPEAEPEGEFSDPYRRWVCDPQSPGYNLALCNRITASYKARVGPIEIQVPGPFGAVPETLLPKGPPEEEVAPRGVSRMAGELPGFGGEAGEAARAGGRYEVIKTGNRWMVVRQRPGEAPEVVGRFPARDVAEAEAARLTRELSLKPGLAQASPAPSAPVAQVAAGRPPSRKPPPRGPLLPPQPPGPAGSRLDDIQAMHDQAENPAQPSILERAKGFTFELERQTADAKAEINKVTARARKALGPLFTPEMDAEAYASTFAGSSGAGLLRFQEAQRPILEVLATRENVKAFNSYVRLQRDIEVGLLKKSPTRKYPGGLRQQELVRSIEDLTQRLGPDRMAIVEEADALRRQAIDTLLDDKVRSGLVSRELAARLRAEQPAYNPTKFLEFLERGTAPRRGPGRGMSQSDNLLRRLTEEGSYGDTETPLQSFYRAVVVGDMAVKRNDTAKAIISAARADPLTAPFVKKVSAAKLVKGAAVAPEPGGMGMVAVKRPGDIPGTLSYFENGERQIWTVPPRLEQAAKSLDAPTAGLLEDIGRILNAPLRAGATTFSPRFLISNPLADAVTTYVRGGVKVAAGIPRGWWHAARRDDFYKGYIRTGGSMQSYFQRQGLQDRKEFERVMQDSGAILLDDHKQFPRLVGDFLKLAWIRRLGEIGELGPRLSMFETELARGASPVQAAMRGRRITVDFSRAGEAVRQANIFSLFLNARVQGTLNVGRSLRDDPAARWRLGSLAAMAVPLYLWNRQFRDEWADVPDFEKDNYAVILLPGSVRAKDGVGFDYLPRITIPLREWALFFAPVQYAIGRLDQTEPRALEEMAGSMGRTGLPLAGEELGGIIGGALPAPFRTPLELEFNKQFFRGTPIVSRKVEGLPAVEQFTERTSAIGRAIGQLAGVSPQQVDFVIRNNLGTVGASMLETSDLLSGKEPERLPSQIMRQVLGTVFRTRGGALENRMFDELQKLQQKEFLPEAVQREYRSLRDQGYRTTIGPVEGEIGGATLTGEERLSYQRLVNERLAVELQRALQSESYQRLTPVNRARALDFHESVARERARGDLVAQYPDIRSRMTKKEPAILPGRGRELPTPRPIPLQEERFPPPQRTPAGVR